MFKLKYCNLIKLVHEGILFLNSLNDIISFNNIAFFDKYVLLRMAIKMVSNVCGAFLGLNNLIFHHGCSFLGLMKLKTINLSTGQTRWNTQLK